MNKIHNLALILTITTNAWAAVPKIPCDELRRMQLIRQPGMVLIDVRPPDDFAQGHIQGARNILPVKLDSSGLPKDGKLVVYCGEDPCALSANAAKKLIGLGYTDVTVLQGGLAEWMKRGYPVEKGTESVHKTRQSMMPAALARKKIEVGKLLVLDVRPALEFSAGHLPSAQNLPLETLNDSIAGLPKEREVLVYDRDATRSRQAAGQLSEAGFKVFELAGGLAGWIKLKQGLEIK